MSYPPIIYKYRSWSNKYHKSILTKNEVYLSAPKGFNDPFDCRIPTSYRSLNTDEKKEEFIDRMIAKHEIEIYRRGLTPEGQKSDMLERMKDIEQFQKVQEEMEFDLQDDRFGILSLTASWDNILMWSHYGDYHKGFCVGFHEELMRKSELFGKGGPVMYRDDFPELLPNVQLSEEEKVQNWFIQSLTKASDWEYEKEYRLASTFMDKAESNDPRRVVTLPDEFYKEIVLGINCSKEDRDDLVSIAQKRNIPIYQAIKKNGQFIIERNLIA